MHSPSRSPLHTPVNTWRRSRQTAVQKAKAGVVLSEVLVWSIKQKNTQYYAVGRNSGGRAQATHTYGARPMESRKLMAPAACIIEVASANTMAEDMAARWCARYVRGDVLDVP